MLFCSKLSAQDSSLNKAGHCLAASKHFQIGAVLATGMSAYAFSQGHKGMGYVGLGFAAACEIISVTYHYKGCQYMIKANGIRITF